MKTRHALWTGVVTALWLPDCSSESAQYAAAPDADAPDTSALLDRAPEIDVTTLDVSDRLDREATIDRSLADDDARRATDVSGVDVFDSRPTDLGPPPRHPMVAIECGDANTCAIDEHGRMFCWGINSHAELAADPESYVGCRRVSPLDGGLLADSCIRRPLAIELPGPVTSIALGDQHTCALTSVGAVYCWGHNDYQQASASPDELIWSPVRVAVAEASAIAVDRHSSCAVRRLGGGITCWGLDFGESPQSFTEDINIRSLSMGGNHWCFVRGDGRVLCWGENDYGQVGYGDYGCFYNPLPSSHSSPVTVVGSTDARSVALAYKSSCALTNGGQVYCWGLASYRFESPGRVTVCGTALGEPVPRRVMIEGVEEFDQSSSHQCALRRDHVLWCWGNNQLGQLGVPTPTTVSVPQPVPGMTEVLHACTGVGHTCALRRDGSVWCWGYNHTGQLGDGTEISRAEPRRVEFDEADGGM